MPPDNPLGDLFHRIPQLSGYLHLRMAELIVNWFARTNDTDGARRYLDERLALVEEFIRPIHQREVLDAFGRLLAGEADTNPFVRDLLDPRAAIERLNRPGTEPREQMLLVAHLWADPRCELNADAEFGLALCLARVMNGRDGRGMALRLFERYLGLAPGEYQTPKLAERMAARVRPRDAAKVPEFVLLFTSLLNFQLHRMRDAAAFLEAYFELSAEDYNRQDRLVLKLDGIRNWGPHMQLAVASTLASVLDNVDRQHHAAAVVDWFLRLSPTQYSNPVAGPDQATPTEALVSALRACVARFDGMLGRWSHAAHMLLSLVVHLSSAGRREHFAAAFDLLTGLPPGDYDSPERLSAFVRDWGTQLDGNGLCGIVQQMSHRQCLFYRPDRAVAISEAFINWIETDRPPSAPVAGPVRSRTLDHESQVSWATSHARNLRHIGRSGDARRFLDGFLGLLPDHYTTPSQFAAGIDSLPFLRTDFLNASSLLAELLHVHQEFSSWPLVADCVAGRIANLFREEREDPAEVEQLMRRSGFMRAALIDGAYTWADEPGLPPAESESRLRRAIRWDAEFGEVRFAFRLRNAPRPADDGGAAPLAGTIRWADLPPEAEPTDGSLRRAGLHALRPLDATLDISTATLARERWLSVSPQSVPPQALGTALAPDELLLRLTLTTKGRVVWYALAGEHNGFRVMARSAPTPPADAPATHATATVAGSVLLHDLGVEWTFLTPDEAATLRGGVLAACKLQIDIGSGLGQLLRETWEYANSGHGTEAQRRWVRLFRNGLQLLGHHASDAEGDPDRALGWASWLIDVLPEAPQMGWLCALTHRAARDLGEVLGLDPLADVPDLQKRHLVVVTDGDLHAIPLSLLPIRGEPLWKRVRSLRMSIAPVAEHELAAKVPVADPSDHGNVLVASWFAPGSDGYAEYLRAARRLHAAHARLGTPDRVFEAHADPGASEPYLRRMTRAPGTHRVLTVMGHGCAEAAAVMLAPGGPGTPWFGTNVPLDRVEFLLLVSCAVGRLRKGSGHDLEGLVTHLLASGGRAVLAARWPIEVRAAVTVAEVVLTKYLELRNSHSSDRDGPLARAKLGARALAAARWALEHNTAAANVLAAFEVYGLG